MNIWPTLAFIFAALEALAVLKNIQRLEYLAKPAVMLCLFSWLYSSTGLRGNPFWFGVGILFSLVGDILLMIPPDRLFLLGLGAFLFAHVSYITGFREELENINARSLVLAIIIAMYAGRLLRRFVGALRDKGEQKLVIPVSIYGTVISIMLYAAMSTIYDPAWNARAAWYVSMGAFLFCASDVVLAWNKFVAPIKSGSVLNIILYHLGQIGLIAGVIAQFG